jgi:hypothetical protein
MKTSYSTNSQLILKHKKQDSRFTKTNLQVLLGDGVVVEHLSDIVDQFDDQFGNIVSRSRFTSKEDLPKKIKKAVNSHCNISLIDVPRLQLTNFGNNVLQFLGAQLLQGVVTVNDTKNVHELTLVLVETFALTQKKQVKKKTGRKRAKQPSNKTKN